MKYFIIICFLISVVYSQNNSIRMGFLYNNQPNDLSWVYSIDLGRNFLGFARPLVKTNYAVVPYGCGNETIQKLLEFSNKNDIVVTTSFAFDKCLVSTAPQYSSKYYLELGGSSVSSNIASLIGRMYEGRYIQGVIAGLISKSKIIGFIDSVPGRGLWDINAFLMGVRSTCSDCVVVQYYCGSYYEPELIAYTAEYLITKENADVLAYLNDAHDHFKIAEKYNVPIFGFDIDQSTLAPTVVVASAYFAWGPMLLRFVDMVLNGTWTPEFAYWGIRENGIGITEINNVNSSVVAVANAKIKLLVDNEFIDGVANGTSWIFCGQEWVKVAPSYAGACLTKSGIDKMNYTVTGIIDKGILKIPYNSHKPPYWAWIVLSLGLFVLVVIVVVVLLAIRYKYHLIFIPRQMDNAEW